jgi:ribonuclease BN (tRNA processing enzyme)
VIISHLHSDHAAGLPSLITQMKLTKRTRPLNIFIHKELTGILKNLLSTFLIFAESLPFEIAITGYDFGNAININSKLLLIGAKNSHLYNKYRIDYIPDEKFISSSFLFSSEERNVFYTADVSDGEDLFLFDEKIDFIISEVTHIQPEKLLQALVKYEPEKILLTHIDDEKKLENWLGNLDKKIRKYFVITYDGMQLKV